MERTSYKKRPIADLKREPKKEVKPVYTMESLGTMLTEDLYKLGTSVKDNPKEATLQQAIVTVLGGRDICNPTF